MMMKCGAVLIMLTVSSATAAKTPEPAAEGAAPATVEALSGMGTEQMTAAATEMESAKGANEAQKSANDLSEFNQRKMHKANEVSQFHQEASDLHRIASQKATDAKVQRTRTIAAHQAMMTAKEALAAATQKEKEAQGADNTACKTQKQKQVMGATKHSQITRLKEDLSRAEDKMNAKKIALGTADKVLEKAKGAKEEKDAELARSESKVDIAQQDWDLRNTELDEARQVASDATDEMTRLSVELGKAKAVTAFEQKEKETSEAERGISRTEYDQDQALALETSEKATRATATANAMVAVADEMATKAKAIEAKLPAADVAG